VPPGDAEEGGCCVLEGDVVGLEGLFYGDTQLGSVVATTDCTLAVLLFADLTRLVLSPSELGGKLGSALAYAAVATVKQQVSTPSQMNGAPLLRQASRSRSLSTSQEKLHGASLDHTHSTPLAIAAHNLPRPLNTFSAPDIA
jgi:CRP-like cAMP-binding protein